MPNLADRLIEIKQKKQILQKDIAENIDISLRSYQRYEKGEREPSSSVIIKLCNYLDVSADYLLGLSDDPKRH